MKMTKLKKILSFILCFMLIAAIALFTIGCNDKKENLGSSNLDTTASQSETNILGNGEKKFTFTVIDLEGKETKYQINTNKKAVGEALLDLGLISGDESEFGLYVKTVNGMTLDYDKDGKYWAFYENGKYAAKGVDQTEIIIGNSYSFKAE